MSGTGMRVISPRVQMYKGPEPAAPAASVGTGGVPVQLDAPIKLPDGHLACLACGIPGADHRHELRRGQMSRRWAGRARSR